MPTLKEPLPYYGAFTESGKMIKLFDRHLTATDEQKKRGRDIASNFGLPRPVDELPSGDHSYERIFTIRRITGYKAVHDSINTGKIMSREIQNVEARCRELGILPLFKGDYITLHSFPRRNIIREEILRVEFRHGIKTIRKKVFFDILYYIDKG